MLPQVGTDLFIELLLIFMEDAEYSGLGLNKVINLDYGSKEGIYIAQGLMERAFNNFDIRIG